MKMATVISPVLLSLGMALSAVLLAACGGSGDAGSSSIAANSSAQITPRHGLTQGEHKGSTNGAGGATTDSGGDSQITPVQDDEPGAVTLTWQPPTQNTNDTPLTDLSGYVIQYGTESQVYTTSITLTNPGLTSYVVENLPAGTYFFSISATTTNGIQSVLSQEMTATVD